MSPNEEGEEENIETGGDEHDLKGDEEGVERNPNESIADDVKEDVDSVSDRQGEGEAEVLVADTDQAKECDAGQGDRVTDQAVDDVLLVNVVRE